ncbi:MAG: T9SS type A sorting domain-containing protein [Ignavibacteriaceae bacterium]|nr:T9SS type A sorting domain-containing protein [Ignavibacteriaceae bacterium]
MKYLILFSLIISFTFAQIDSLDEALKYYPLQIGNYWEYKNYYWEIPFYKDSSAHSIEIIGDTILLNNRNYKILLQKNIPDDGFSFKIYERVDSLTACVYRYSTDTVFINNEYLVDSLLAQPGDYFAGSRTGYSSFGNGIFSTLCVAEYEDTVLDLITDVKELQDQSFIPGLNYTLAKGLGFVSSISCEFSCGSTNLVYALINGVEYGDRITKVEENEIIALPSAYILYQNFPNPFNPTTTISFYLPCESEVKLLIYDLKGALICKLANEYHKSGKYKYTFDASVYSSGLYFYRLITDEIVLSKKMLLIK